MRGLLVLAVVLAVFGAAYWWATGGGYRGSREFDWLVAEPVAHRGLHASPAQPENSLAAFRAAADAGFPIELDLHLSADRVPVVIHDDDLERMTGDARTVSEVTAAELRRLALKDSEETIPTLEEVLDLVDGRVPLFLEIKNRGEVGVLEDEVIRELEEYGGDVAVMSFNPYVLAHFAQKAPDLPRGQLSGSFEGEDLSFLTSTALKGLLMNWKSRPDFVGYELDALPSVSTRWQQLQGRPLLAWTATTPDERVRALDVADGVICDPGALEP